MSDMLSDIDMYLSEPDETVLTAALRNKDDIPILMDIVGDDAVPESQEMYFEKSMSDVSESDSKPARHDSENRAPQTDRSVASEYMASAEAAQLSDAIETVLQRRLPEIIEEVMLEISKRNSQQ